MTQIEPRPGVALIDLGSEDGLRHLARFLNEVKGWIRNGTVDNIHGGTDDLDAILDGIDAALPEPRIPEPGLWGVVEAGVKQHDQRLKWVRLGDNYRPDDSDEYDRLWDDLIDPTLIRDGIEDGAK